MTSASYQFANLLEKMQSSDKDFRFMATNDLMAKLEKDSIKLDDESERKVVRMLLKLLEDKNGEVQNLAAKCLGPLVNKVKELQVETIIENLCANIISDNRQLRDISSICLKTVICKLPQTPGGLSDAISKCIIGHLNTAIDREDVLVQLEALDIISDLLNRFGYVLSSFHLAILNALLPQLCSSYQAVRKRTIVALGNLVLLCNNELYSRLIEYIYSGFRFHSANSLRGQTNMQCLITVCRQSVPRFGEHIQRFIIPIFQFSDEEEEETRELCLQVFEAFVQKFPKEMVLHIPRITELCTKYISYDPNYNYEAEDTPIDMDEDEDNENMEYSDDDDDDDMSWKVRRAAAKCLESIISSNYALSEVYRTILPFLIAQFKEREESVKADIFRAFIALLRQTKRSDDDLIHLLQQQIPLIIKEIRLELTKKSLRIRQDCLQLLKEICNVSRGALAHHLGDLIPGIQFCLGDKNNSSSMKINALQFIHCILESHPPMMLYPHMKYLIPLVINCVGDSFYKISAEALHVLQALVKVIRPLNTKSNFDDALYDIYKSRLSKLRGTEVDQESNFDYAPFVGDIYKCALSKLKAPDVGQEVKELAISTMSQIITHLGDSLQDELSVCLPLFLDQLKSEVTRLTTVKSLKKIANSKLHVNLTIINDAIILLTPFLCKNQRTLKLGTLKLLNCFINNYHPSICINLLTRITERLPPLIDESDIQMAQWTLTFLTSIGKHHPLALKDIELYIIPKVMNLVLSPLLQGTPLTTILGFFKTLVKCAIPGLTDEKLLQTLLYPVLNQKILDKHAYNSLAKCVAAVTVTCGGNSLEVVHGFLENIKEGIPDSQHVFYLIAIAEIGKEVDLTNVEHLRPVILQSFSAMSEDVKVAAAYALGNGSIADLGMRLEFICSNLATLGSKRKYFLLSLKEAITCMSSTPGGVNPCTMHTVLHQLINDSECLDEEIRNVVAECLGRIILTYSKGLPDLLFYLRSHIPKVRATVVTALKFAISDQPQAVDALLGQYISSFLETLQDSDLNVRRLALVVLNSIAHNKPFIIKDLLDSILPHLYDQTKVKKELIKEVQMGPFKHIADDGLDIRKAAFECMYTLLDSPFLDKINVFEFLNHVEYGLKDHYDIKMLTHLITARLARAYPEEVLQRLERLVDLLRVTCTIKIRADSVHQEFAKLDELKRSALRLVTALLMIPNADKDPHLQNFIYEIKNTHNLLVIFESVQKDVNTHSYLLMN